MSTAWYVFVCQHTVRFSYSVIEEKALLRFGKVQGGPEKMHKVQFTVILQPFAVESRVFHQNAQKLTGNTKNWHKIECCN